MASQRQRPGLKPTNAPPAASDSAHANRPADDALLIFIRILARQAARDAFLRERSSSPRRRDDEEV